jgi:hypothetical protein
MSSEMNFSFEDYLNNDIDTGFESNYFDDAFEQGQRYDSSFQISNPPTEGFGTVDDEALQQTSRDIGAESALYRLELPALGADVALAQPFALQKPSFSINPPREGNVIA